MAASLSGFAEGVKLRVLLERKQVLFMKYTSFWIDLEWSLYKLDLVHAGWIIRLIQFFAVCIFKEGTALPRAYIVLVSVFEVVAVYII